MDLSVLEFSRAVCCEEPIFAECLTWSQKQTLAVISDAFQANFAKYKKEFPNVHLTVNRRKQQEKKIVSIFRSQISTAKIESTLWLSLADLSQVTLPWYGQQFHGLQWVKLLTEQSFSSIIYITLI